ncbi:hypothetical protein Tco_0132520 [Tanacetum coccineum]
MKSNLKTTHSRTGVRSYASVSTLPPSSILKLMAWWKEQTKAWEKQILDRRNTTSFVGTPHHDQDKQWGNVVLANIQNRSSYPSKNWHAYLEDNKNRHRDLVYRSNDASHAEDGGKLGPKWEGPYEVTKALGKGVYKLRDRNG